jgi:cytochrome c oxidase subunit 5b
LETRLIVKFGEGGRRAYVSITSIRKPATSEVIVLKTTTTSSKTISTTMYQAVLRAARPASSLVRKAAKPSTLGPRTVSRAFATTIPKLSTPPPQIYGEGAKPGTVPTDFEQATGLERLELLGDMEGVAIFDTEPLDSSRMGTLDDPILVPSLVSIVLTSSVYEIPDHLRDVQDVERIVGCTGFPADSHDVLWFNLTEKKKGRCPECGNGEHRLHAFFA